MAIPKILIGAPQNVVKDYCFDDWLDTIKSFNYPLNKLDIFLADNSPTDEYARKLAEQYGIKTVWSNPAGRHIKECMTESHNLVRDYALRNKYDFLLHLETDVMPQSDCITQLLFVRKPIVAGLYQVGTGANRHIMAQLPEPIMGENKKIFYNATHDFADGTVKQVFHAGLGCVLMHKSVLSKFTFRWNKDIDWHPDTFFAKDMWDSGQPIYLHTGVFCGHQNKQYWSN